MIFSKGSKLHIISDNVKYTYLLKEASLSQNVREASYSRNTIHSPSMVDYSFADTKTPVSVSLGLYLGAGESQIFEWMGLYPEDSLGYVSGYKVAPAYRQDLSTAPSLYLESRGAVYEVSSAVLMTASFLLGPRTVAAVNISAQGSELNIVSSVPETSSTVIQSSSTFYSSSLQVGGIERISSLSLEYTRDVSWIGFKGIHQIGDVVSPTKPVLTRFALSGTITVYTDGDNPLYIDSRNYPIVISDKEFTIGLDSCMVSTRYNTTGDIHTTSIDYKLNPI